jgi:hypothetical protein
MELVTTWRSSERARWLGWTVVFGLVLVGSGWLAQLPGMGIVSFALPLIAAFLIGWRYRSFWWAAGPAAALLTLLTAGILWSLFGPQVPKETAFGMRTPREQLGDPFALLIFVLGFPLGSALFGVSAAAGVWWGLGRDS